MTLHSVVRFFCSQSTQPCQAHLVPTPSPTAHPPSAGKRSAVLSPASVLCARRTVSSVLRFPRLGAPIRPGSGLCLSHSRFPAHFHLPVLLLSAHVLTRFSRPSPPASQRPATPLSPDFPLVTLFDMAGFLFVSQIWRYPHSNFPRALSIFLLQSARHLWTTALGGALPQCIPVHLLALTLWPGGSTAARPLHRATCPTPCAPFTPTTG